jgi:peptidoglycan/LPS O-acetylase OafA/YrhL
MNMKAIAEHLPSPQQNKHYMPYLDGLRAIAVIAVLISHFAFSQQWLIANAEWGRLGVDLFFVLSGFLITGILLRYRDNSHSFKDTLAHLRIFYSRRALRIFPIYYLTIGIAALFGYEPVRNFLFWHLTYTSNIAIAFYKPQFEAAHHFWSLCIEEQFYLIWPWVVLLVPRKWLRYVIYGFIVIGPVSRMLPIFIPGFSLDPLLNTRLDLLSFGGLLALYWHEPTKFYREKFIVCIAGVTSGLPLVILFMTNNVTPGLQPMTGVLVEFGISLFFMALIDRAAQPHPWPIFTPLGWKPVRYIGKISYGIYLYHPFVSLLGSRFFLALNIQEPPSGLAQLLLYGSVSILIASLSWYLIERPVNRWKERISETITPAVQPIADAQPTPVVVDDGEVVATPAVQPIADTQPTPVVANDGEVVATPAIQPITNPMPNRPWAKALALVLLLIASILIVIVLIPTQYDASNYTTDAGWVTELENQLHQGNVLGRDVFFTYGPLAQVLVSAASWVRYEPSALYGYGINLAVFDIFSLILLVLALFLIRDLDWVGAAFVFCLTFFFHTVVIFRPLISVLGMIVLVRGIEAPPRRRYFWAAAAGVIWFCGQLITLEIVFLGAAAAIGWAAICALFSIKQLSRWPFQQQLLPALVYLKTVGISMAVILIANIVLEIFYRLSSTTYSGFSYFQYSMATLQGYTYTMGVDWSMDNNLTYLFIIMIVFTTFFAIWIALKSKSTKLHLLISLLILSVLYLRSAIIRSDMGHIFNAAAPFTILFLLVAYWMSEYRRLYILGLVLVAILLGIWPLRLLDSSIRVADLLITQQVKIIDKLRATRRTVINLDSIVPPRFRAAIDPQKQLVLFPDANVIGMVLGNQSLAPVLQAYSANGTNLQEFYTQTIDHQKSTVEIIYGLDSNSTNALEQVQYGSRTPIIFRYLYEHFRLKTNEIFRNNFFVLTPRDQPRPMTFTPIAYITQRGPNNSWNVTTNQPTTCGLLELDLTVAYPFTAAIGRPSHLNLRVLNGDQVVRNVQLVPVEVGKRFVTYVYLGPDQIFHHLFREDQNDMPGVTFDRLTLAPTPGDPLTVYPNHLDLSNIRCVGNPNTAITVVTPQEVIALAYALPNQYVPTEQTHTQGGDIFMHADGSLDFDPFQASDRMCLTGIAWVARPETFELQADGVEFVIIVHDGTTIISETHLTNLPGGFAPFNVAVPSGKPFQIRLKTLGRSNDGWDWAYWKQPQLAACVAP